MTQEDMEDDKSILVEPAIYHAMHLYANDDDLNKVQTCFDHQISGRYELYFHSGAKPQKTCFVAGTSVWTLGGVKKIEDVEKGDMVLTHYGRFCKVVDTYKYPLGERRLHQLYNVHGEYIATATNDHSFLVYDSTTCTMLWKRLDQLSKKDFLLRSHLTDDRVNEFTELDTGNAYMDEFVRKHPRITGLLLAVSPTQYEDHDEVCFMDADVPHSHMTLYKEIIGKHVDNKGVRIQAGVIHVNDTVLVRAFLKHETRMSIWKWTLLNKIQELARGWLDYFEESFLEEAVYNPEEAGLVCMLMNCLSEENVHFRTFQGRILRKEFRIRNRFLPCTCVPFRRTIVHKEKNFVKFGKTRMIKPQHVDDPFVYTLNVANDHSFTVNGILAQNCNLRSEQIQGISGGAHVLYADLTTRPICDIKKGDFVLDKDRNPTSVIRRSSHQYEGDVLCRGKHAATPNLYDRQSDVRFQLSGVSKQDGKDDNTVPMPLLRFIIRFFYEWDIHEDGHDWLSWEISIMDNMMIRESILSFFHTFEYSYMDGHVIKFKKPALASFLRNVVPKLPTMSLDKIVFFEAQTRQTAEKNQLFPDLTPLLSMTRSLSGRQSVDDMLTNTSYDDEVFHLSTTSGSYITEIGIIDENNPFVFLSGTTRIMTPDGVATIAEKFNNDQALVWDGKCFVPLEISKEGWMDVAQVEISHGGILECSVETRVGIQKEDGSMEIVRVKDLKPGDMFSSYTTPMLSSRRLPSGVRCSLEWLHNKSMFFDNKVMVRDRDRDSLIDLLIDMIYCGLHGEIFSHHPKEEHTLHIGKEKWKLLQEILASGKEEDRWTGNVEGLSVVGVSMTGKKVDMYKVRGPIIANGVQTGIAPISPSATIHIREKDTVETLCKTSYDMVSDMNRFYDLNGNKSHVMRPLVVHVKVHEGVREEMLLSFLESIYYGMITSSMKGTMRYPMTKENSPPSELTTSSLKDWKSLMVSAQNQGGLSNGSIRLCVSKHQN